MQGWIVHYKGFRHYVSHPFHTECIKVLAVEEYPELSDRDNFNIVELHLETREVHLKPSYKYLQMEHKKKMAKPTEPTPPTYVNDKGEEFTKAPEDKKEVVPPEDRSDVETPFLVGVSIMLDDLARKGTLDLIKQQIDEALDKGDHEKCAILCAKLKSLTDIPKEEMV